ncbi:hypothetical protein [Alteromonas sp. ASW11-130]|uniref:hypothetical protein n=1 Tax=Alteromonas sp. ASW11-130 TaxID=3015775 RepID=UPI0022418901|nr:hypothetical protein [Alteromonas sp. ASW11-130]MCW8090636.1 hypothetical protein [Alteromonas sp. ASW11-130]
MKAFYASLLLLFSLSSQATVVRYDLDHLIGESLYRSVYGEDAGYLLLDIDNSPIKVMQEARIVVNLENINLSSAGRLVFRIFGDESAAYMIDGDNANITMEYSGEYDPLVNVSPWLDEGFWEFQFTLDSYVEMLSLSALPSADEFVMFGENSYLEISDTVGELLTVGVSEPLIAGMVALAGVGLGRRRKLITSS